ncbi:phosphatidate cytidylyltransferase [Ruminococcus flavefaciens]|uniref:phosphatidate cytidylyltransferase n=1 Tax=Ruminococcus flavefaciens TaxID=1265 RepID=UPI0026F29B21|nr:phosphatidate cytidylyltransferase [Ruminococcus flavefaciens]MDD7517732.1 phosphatidate cytidylyltransferase [Ruminococcus flavefaciens]MDY5690533.1 phosphatidate cytidylyltransferase [Ruminococcus flavefaciens]
MLTRIISGAVGVVLLGAVLFFHDTIVLPIAVAAIIAVMLFELLRAVKLHKCLPILIAAEACGIAVPILYGIFTKLSVDGPAVLPHNEFKAWRYAHDYNLYVFGIILLCAFVVFITWLRKHKEIRYEQVFFVLAVMILVPQAMTTMVRMERYDSENGLFLLIMGLCGAWIADTGAYFTGVALGKHKLCPEISPKKTIEGLVGGILTTAIVYTVAFSCYYGFTAKRAVIAFITGAVCAVIGTVGDLSASMVKRQIGFKDYGKIMPGHGGLMDRFDSVLFVLPTFYVFITLFGVQ